ncbi:MAG: hypothetical protein ABMB14_13065 [Myxococcota bacterium]
MLDALLEVYRRMGNIAWTSVSTCDDAVDRTVSFSYVPVSDASQIWTSERAVTGVDGFCDLAQAETSIEAGGDVTFLGTATFYFGMEKIDTAIYLQFVDSIGAEAEVRLEADADAPSIRVSHPGVYGCDLTWMTPAADAR